jgi:hypothetical protein
LNFEARAKQSEVLAMVKLLNRDVRSEEVTLPFEKSCWSSREALRGLSIFKESSSSMTSSLEILTCSSGI